MGLDQHFVVADAGPLIALSRIGALNLLRQLLGEVWITSVVRHELLDTGPFQGQTEIVHVLSAWLRETTVEIMDWRSIHPGIDPGEASSICLAEQHPNSLLIIDDRAGRLEAKARGLRYIGLPGLIVQARRMGKLDEARPLLDALRRVGYFMSDTLMAQLLQQAGEPLDF